MPRKGRGLKPACVGAHDLRSEDLKMNGKKKSLVLITVDCLRADHCGFYGYSRPTTPFLDTLAGESFVFSEAVVAGAPTYYSLPGILASRMPLALGRDMIGLAPGENAVATALRKAGYATAAFSAANPYISSRFGYDQGFGAFDDGLDFGASSANGADGIASPRSENSSTRARVNRSLKRTAHALGLGPLYDELYFQYCMRVAALHVESIDSLQKFPSAEEIVDRASAWLPSIDGRPFFLWLHLMDPHSPYYPSAAAYHEFTGKDISPERARYLNEFWNRSDLGPARLSKKKNSVIDLYDAGIRAADAQIGRLVSQLRRLALWDDCVLALTADHGEEFLDHGRRYHAPMALREEIARVPLMIRVPGFAGKKRSATFSHLHLAPTLLEILDVPSPASFQGVSISQSLLQDQSRPDEAFQDQSTKNCAVTECIYGCTNPLRNRDRMGPRLLSVRKGGHKLVMRMEAGAIEELYDLEADPEEQRPLAPGARKEIRVQLLRAARLHMERASNGAREEFRLKARLRSLRGDLQSKSR